MTAAATQDQPKAAASIEDYRRRVDELGRIILAYSDATERLQQSHDTLGQQVAQLQEELGEKNRELQRRNRLEALGEMAAGIAHEIRNPLGAIKLYATLLRDDVKDRPEAGKTIGKISNAIGRMEAIVSQVLYFTREIRPVPVQCDLAELVREQVDVARARLSERVEVAFVIDGPAEMSATFDPNLLAQALLNILINAADACGERGTVTVKLGRSKKRARVTIADTGAGFADGVVEKIFDPFFTTKDHGTGLGLAIVNRIAEAHGGTIEARNAKGGGAVFEITV